jgi:hypothetical protein
MKTYKFILPIIITLAISASGAPVAAGVGAPAAVSKSPTMPLQPGNTPLQQDSKPIQPGSAPLQPGSVPQQPGVIPNNNNVGNGTFINGGNGTFIQPSSPAQPGSPVAGGQTMVSNNVTGQTITGQNTNQSGLGTRQQYNQQGWMTNRPPLQTNDSHLQPWMTNHPTNPMGNANMPPK